MKPLTEDTGLAGEIPAPGKLPVRFDRRGLCW
jgi:hypothetical protein